MIKDKLMRALKMAADDYNGGTDASEAVAKAAMASDFNEKQAERLAEMLNTALVLGKEKDASDPAGTCNLADKKKVTKILLDSCAPGGSCKAASCVAPHMDPEYSFYGSVPSRTSPSIEARASGRRCLEKAASAESPLPSELDVSQRSLYKIISDKIDLLKSAASSADDAARALRSEADNIVMSIARDIESPYASYDAADMFKLACDSRKVVDMVSMYSTKVAESDGGRFSKMNVFDTSPIDAMLKYAAEVQEMLSEAERIEKARDHYMLKAAEGQADMMSAVGIGHDDTPHNSASVADLFIGNAKIPVRREEKSASAVGRLCERLDRYENNMQMVSDALEDMEKSAVSTVFSVPVPNFSADDAYKSVVNMGGVDNEQRRKLNARRGVIVSDLMTNDPIIRDANPKTIIEAYKTMVMSAPRVSLDKAQVRSFLRAAASSEAISPNDAKVITDVDKGMSLSNIDRLTLMDSSIKDSNEV